MEEMNEEELLKKCSVLNEKHEKLKQEILERSMLNEKAILELNEIEQEYKNIVESLREVTKFV
jgi:DNA-binding protein H-NS